MSSESSFQDKGKESPGLSLRGSDMEQPGRGRYIRRETEKKQAGGRRRRRMGCLGHGMQGREHLREERVVKSWNQADK